MRLSPIGHGLSVVVFISRPLRTLPLSVVIFIELVIAEMVCSSSPGIRTSYLTHFNAMHINEENVVPNNAIILDWVVTNILWDIPMCLILKIILRLCYTTTSWLVVK